MRLFSSEKVRNFSPPYEIVGELHRVVPKGSADTFAEVTGASCGSATNRRYEAERVPNPPFLGEKHPVLFFGASYLTYYGCFGRVPPPPRGCWRRVLVPATVPYRLYATYRHGGGCRKLARVLTNGGSHVE